jgi:hypothetical protein
VNRFVEVVAVTLLLLAALVLVLGVLALAEGKDLTAVYWAAVGAVLLKASVEVLRPQRN